MNPEDQPLDKPCPECGEMMTGERNSERIRGRIVRWVDYTCECGHEENNEPDYDNL